MKELKDIQFDHENVVLNSNRVQGSILPKNVDELGRDIKIQSDTIVEGAVYGHRISIDSGDVEIKGAAFAQLEIYVNSGAKGVVKFDKSLGAVESVVSHARECKVLMLADVNAREVRLTNTFIGGSIFADNISLENCVVIGGVFANKELFIKNSIVGTFNSQSVTLESANSILLPSAFSLEPINYNKGTTTLYNLALADLGAAYRGVEQNANTGRIKMNLDSDRLKSTLSSENSQMSVCNYTIIGKVLAADMIDWEKMQNHFLLTAAALGPKLLNTYDLGLDSEGKKATLTPEKISDFFMNLLGGKIQIKEIDGTFAINDITNNLK